MQLILLGAPGSGKGTLAADLIKLYQIPHISTGDIFRKNIKENTPLGLEAKQYISSGGLVPDSVTIAMVADYLAQPDCANGFMLDGFPRTLPQAEALTAILAEKKLPLTAVLNLQAAEQTIIDRLAGRRVCNSCGRVYNVKSFPTKIEGVCDVCGGTVIQRDDDKPQTVLNRLETYKDQTAPLVGYYDGLGLLINVDSDSGVSASLEILKNALDKLIARE